MNNKQSLCFRLLCVIISVRPYAVLHFPLLSYTIIILQASRYTYSYNEIINLIYFSTDAILMRHYTLNCNDYTLNLAITVYVSVHKKIKIHIIDVGYIISSSKGFFLHIIRQNKNIVVF